MSIEAMQRWLECAERCESLDGKYSWADVIFTIKESIEQAQKQEPVAWITEKISGPTKGYMTVTFNKDTGWKDARSIPLYEHPPQRQPLTDEQIKLASEAVEQIMEQAQVFASAWSIVGGRFSNCNAAEEADEAKNELRVMVVSLAIEAAHGITGEQK